MKSLLILASAIAAVMIASCSASDARPSALGDCPPDSGCAAMGSVGGGGGSSGGEEEEDAGTGSGSGSGGSSGGTCSSSSSESQCSRCAASNCCSLIVTCDSNTACQNLASCAQNCTTQACLTGCEQQYPTADGTYNEIQTCINGKCPVCSESGVGDTCANCVSGLSCPGEWCTRACAKSSDCGGIGPNGGNFTGNLNVCLHAASGNLCWPGCASDSDCLDFPGTYCGGTTDVTGAAVKACVPMADAGPG